MSKVASSLVVAILRNIVIGAVLGIANVIPGVSGGTMAASFGIFDQLIGLISNLKTELTKNWKKNLLFLIPLGIGLVASILLFSKLVTYLLTNHPVPTNFFFIGVILGSIPLIYKKAVKPKFTAPLLIPFLITLAIMILTAVFFGASGKDMAITALNLPNFFLLLVYGAIAAACMIVPGISGSFILVLLGAYQSVMTMVSELNIPLLIPFGIGALLGLFLCAKGINLLLKHFEQLTYAGILGFVIGSIFTIVREILPITIGIWEWVICIVVLLAGGAATLWFNAHGEA